MTVPITTKDGNHPHPSLPRRGLVTTSYKLDLSKFKIPPPLVAGLNTHLTQGVRGRIA